MFTGLIEEIGTVQRIRKLEKSSALTIQAKRIFDDLRLGDSVAVNGVCLTAANKTADTFTADVMYETLSRSALGGLIPGSHVNLERAMPANGRFGGHMVSGHIDGTGIISNIRQDGDAVWYTVKAPANILKYIVEKGSIAIDGISLTVAEVSSGQFSVSIIPHTARNTILSETRVGSIVNLENDAVGKYVEKLMDDQSAQKHQSSITKEFLMRFGY